jgi:hypothetical protein
MSDNFQNRFEGICPNGFDNYGEEATYKALSATEQIELQRQNVLFKKQVEELSAALDNAHEQIKGLSDTTDFAVNLAEYYQEKQKPLQYQIGIDTFDRIKSNSSYDEIAGACKLNIDKYIWRVKGSDREDLLKAKDYIDLWIWAIDNKKDK